MATTMTYEETYTSTTTTTTNDSGVLDRRYIRDIPGIIKYCEMGLTFIAYVCVEASLVVCVPWIATTGYFKFATMFAFTTTLILYFLLLFKLHQRIFRCACVNWPLFEMGYYGAMLLLLFFGDLFLSLHACHNAHKAGVAFGWFALAPYGADMFFAVRTFLAARNEARASAASPQADMNNMEDPVKY